MRLRNRKWAAQLIDSNKDVAKLGGDVDETFFDKFDVIEIGAGCGEFLIELSQEKKDSNFLGIEVVPAAFSIAIKKLAPHEEIDNLVFLNSDIDAVFLNIRDSSFNYIFLNFSDPWPKKRHNKRRLTYSTRLEEYYRLLKCGGRVCFKTDNDILFNDSVEYFKASKFEIESIDYNYDGNANFDATSEYEKKFRKLGTPIKRAVLIKR